MNEPRILINGAFRGQRITGQQRYATEIARRLLERGGVREKALSAQAQTSAARAWVGSQFIGRGRASTERLLTLTSRGPVRAHQHIVVVHDLFVLDHPEWYSRTYIASHAPVLKAQLRTAELVVTVSEPVAMRVQNLLRRGTPVITVPNAPAELFVPGPRGSDDVVRHGLRAGQYILAVSSQEPRKNIARLIAAHAMLPARTRDTFPLVLAGGTNSIYARGGNGPSRPAGRSVIRLGYVDDHELARLYAGSAVVAFPSLDEGFGLPAVEAIASGTDVLVADVPVLRWVCGDLARYANPMSTASISDALRDLLDNPTSPAERLRKAELVRARFAWQDSADKLYSAVTKLSAVAQW